MRWWRAAVVATSSLLLTSLATVPTGAEAPEAGRLSEPLRQLVAEARAADSHCVAVVRDGRRILHRDLDRTVGTSEVWSVTKSITSLLVGIAQDKGMLDVDERVAKYVPAWRRTPSRKVRIRHLLANTSGREWSIRTDYERMAGRAPDKTRYSIRLGQDARPGRTWVYNNAAIQVLERVLRRATGQPVPAFARRHLFGPLKMRRTSFQLDGAGNAMTFGGVLSTCRDLAKLGVMLADGGKHKGRRLVSRRYLKQATRRPSSRHNKAYGRLFWINEPGPVLGSLPQDGSRPGPLVPGAGADAFWALGLNEQWLFVSPSRDVVGVRLGAAPPPDSGLDLARFTGLVLAGAHR